MLMLFIGAEQKQAVEETKAVFGPLRERITAAVEKLEGLLVGVLFFLSISHFQMILQWFHSWGLFL